MKNRHASKKRTSDFGPGTEPSTIMLKERTWRFEVNRTNAKRFLKKHKIATIVSCAVIVAGAVTQFVLVGLASTANFYPSSCLGNWQNVQNALGKPDLSAGASASAFSSLNSAVFGTGTAQMFCGNFSGDTDISALKGKTFQEADLVLSWSFSFPSIATDTAGGGGSTTADGSSTPSIADASSSLLIATSTDVSSTPGDAIATEPTTTPSTPSTTQDLTPSSTVTPAPPPATTTTIITATSGTDNSTSGTSSDTTVVAPSPSSSPAPTPTPAPTPPPPTPEAPAPTDGGTAPAAAPTSWIKKFVNVAFADTISSTADGATTTLLADSSTVDAIGTSTAPPITIDTSVFQNIALPSGTPPNAILAIVYSTDGVTWQPLVDVDASNWQQARYKIPISSWEELQHLQIAFIGLGASGSPQIYLDAAGVEVSYVDAPASAAAPDFTPPPAGTPSSTPPAADATATNTPPMAAPASTLPPPAEALKSAFSPWAGQTCAIDPFSASIARGNTAAFLLKLNPPKTSSSAPAASSSFLYDAEIGTLPGGVNAHITTAGFGNDTIVAQADNDAAPGSYSVIVVYRERQADGSVLPNYCQFGLVVK